MFLVTNLLLGITVFAEITDIVPKQSSRGCLSVLAGEIYNYLKTWHGRDYISLSGITSMNNR